VLSISFIVFSSHNLGPFSQVAGKQVSMPLPRTSWFPNTPKPACSRLPTLSDITIGSVKLLPRCLR
jgi:hypothetical protein